MKLDRIRLFLDGSKSGAANMAEDEALLVTSTEPVLRVYHWSAPTISLGYSCRIARVRFQYADRRGEPFAYVRRCTGGGSVEHDEHEGITYSLVFPASCPLARARPRDLYWWIHRCLATAMADTPRNELSIADEQHSRDSIDSACFSTPVPGDLMAGKRKIAGAAMRRHRHCVLIQGSIAKAGGVDDELPARFADCLSESHLEWNPFSEIPDFAPLVSRLEREKYASLDWLERR